MFANLILIWNKYTGSGRCSVYQENDGRRDLLNYGYVYRSSIDVRLRQVNNRWECFGYFNQGPSLPTTPDRRVTLSSSPTEEFDGVTTSSGPVSDQIFKPILSDGKASNTFSPIARIDIKPVTGTHELNDTRDCRSSLIVDSWKNDPIESVADLLRRLSVELTDGIEELCLWTKVLDCSHKEAMRPAVDRFLLRVLKAGIPMVELLDHIHDTATNQQENEVLAWLMQGIKDRELGQVKKNKDEVAEQKEDEVSEQKKDKDVEQRKREEAEAAAAAYAAQDRYDSCSDSD